MSDIGVSSHEANGHSLGDILRKARTTVKMPPHDDTVEVAIEAKIAAALGEQEAYAKRRLETLYSELDNLKKVLNTTSHKASLALKAHSQTLIAVRIQTENLERAVKELSAGHEELKDLYDR